MKYYDEAATVTPEMFDTVVDANARRERSQAVRAGKRGPDDGSKERMRTFHLPEACEQF